MAGSVGLFVSMPKGSVDQKDSAYIAISLRYHNGTPISKINDGISKMDSILAEKQGVKNRITIAGVNEAAAQYGNLQGANVVQFMIFPKEGTDSAKFVKEIRKTKDQFPDAELTADTAGLLGVNKTTVSVDVIGKNEADIKKAADLVKKEISTIDGVQKVESNDQNTKPTVTITVDSKVSNAQEISQSIYAMIQPAAIGSMKIDGRTTTVKLGAIKEIQTVNDLKDLQLMTPNGPVALSSFANVEESKEPGTIYSKDGHHYLQVNAFVDSDKMVDVAGEIQKQIAQWDKNNTFGKETSAKITGSAMQSSDDLLELGKLAMFS
ncbi:efflux RND transporter permease subunit, partial [Neobacillus drentensis]|uniref:efflux RND transporter permease subunit n=1 Tax=Neobacillus drentensis TaxID=220684 RepID=UPI0030008F6E